VFFQGADLFNIAQESVDGTNEATTAYYVEAELPDTASPQFVLLQTFSPGANGSGGAANNMTAWLAAECNYTGTNEPKLVSVRLNNADNVLGPLQFDNNINTNPTISSEISLLGQHGSVVTLGNVIILPFNNDSFLYIRPLYVTAASNGGTSFPQLQEVIVGHDHLDAVAITLGDAHAIPVAGCDAHPDQHPFGHAAAADHRPGQQDRHRQLGS
jgi:uncharacterized membrane protein (UPF0182 family)